MPCTGPSAKRWLRNAFADALRAVAAEQGVELHQGDVLLVAPDG